MQSSHSYKQQVRLPRNAAARQKAHNKSYKRNFYPELDRIRPVQREYSNLNSITSSLVVHKQKTCSSAAGKLSQTVEALQKDGTLPEEIKIFLRNSKNRYPLIHSPNGSIYVGEMANQQQHGFGFCQQPSKSYYFGNWFMGKRQGHGTYSHENGTKYQGYWVNDLLNGEGICQNPNGTFYKGEWLN